MAKVPILLFEKETAPPGSAPLVIAQSGSMARCAAKLAGIYPEDPADCARADALFESAPPRSVAAKGHFFSKLVP